MAGLIIDLRSDPGGLLTQAIDVGSDFIRSGEIVSTARATRRTASAGTPITPTSPAACPLWC